MKEYQKKDVIVVGGGVSGIMASIASARNGANTLLIERYGLLGGTATTGLMGVFMGFDRKVINGLAAEFVDRMIELNGAIEDIYTIFDTEVFKIAAFKFIRESGVELLLHTWTEEAIMQRDTIKGVVTHNKLGQLIVPAEIVIDASGDGDVFASAGVEYEVGEGKEGIMQPVTLIFKMANVNVHKLFEYVVNNPDQFSKGKYQTIIKEKNGMPYIIAPGFFDLVKNAKKNGDLQLDHNLIVVCNTPHPNEVMINATRSINVNGMDPFDLTRAEVETREQMVSLINFLKKYVPGFTNSYLTESATSIGIRETRRMKGEYVLNEEDIIEGRLFNDSIAKNFFPMDIHGPSTDPEGHYWRSTVDAYEIPYRCLLPRKINNLLVAGRCISTTHYAQGSTRSMPCCMATGQAAGTASALCVNLKKSTRELDINLLQKTLVEQGAII